MQMLTFFAEIFLAESGKIVTLNLNFSNVGPVEEKKQNFKIVEK